MMFLTKLVLNLRDAQARNDLARPYDLHRRLAVAFPTPDGTDYRQHHQVLYRVEAPTPRSPYPQVLVQSASGPDLGQLPEGYALRAESRQFTLPAFQAGQQLSYRLLASPTRSVKRDGHKHSKRVPLSSRLPADAAETALSPVEAWLVRKGARHGFRIVFMHLNPVMLGQPGRAAAGKQNLMLGGVQFDGHLEVTDPALFEAALKQGIGPGKAFGFGLLSVARPQAY